MKLPYFVETIELRAIAQEGGRPKAKGRQCVIWKITENPSN